MTQTPNSTGNTGPTADAPDPSTEAERVPPMTPPGTAPVPPVAAKPSGSSPAATGTPGSSVPAPGKVHAGSDRTADARDSDRGAVSHTATGAGRPAKDGGGADSGRPLFAPEERDRFDARIHQAVAGFVENPRQAVQEADATFDEVVAGLTEALATRSRLLRADRDGERSEAGTEDLRIALQHYRDLTERLVRL